MKFSLDQKVDKLHLCGCKLTSNAPFCDGKTCMMLADGEKFESPVEEEHIESVQKQ
jgi:CDGSH-type Zn-finger protein